MKKKKLDYQMDTHKTRYVTSWYKSREGHLGHLSQAINARGKKTRAARQENQGSYISWSGALGDIWKVYPRIKCLAKSCQIDFFREVFYRLRSKWRRVLYLVSSFWLRLNPCFMFHYISRTIHLILTDVHNSAQQLRSIQTAINKIDADGSLTHQLWIL